MTSVVSGYSLSASAGDGLVKKNLKKKRGPWECLFEKSMQQNIHMSGPESQWTSCYSDNHGCSVDHLLLAWHPQ